MAFFIQLHKNGGQQGNWCGRRQDQPPRQKVREQDVQRGAVAREGLQVYCDVEEALLPQEKGRGRDRALLHEAGHLENVYERAPQD